MGTKVYDNYADLITFNRNSKGTALRPIGYGDELVTNGTFDTDSDWAKNSLWAISGGVATQPAGASPDYLKQSDVLTIGKVYQYSIEVVSGNGSNFPQLYTEAGVVASFTSGVGTYTGIFVAAGNDVWIRALSSTIDVSVDNVSVKEVLFDRDGDPLTLFTHPAGVPRIEYDADRNLKGLLIEPQAENLFTQSDGSNWVANSTNVEVTRTLNAGTSPDGTTNATGIKSISGNTGCALRGPAGQRSFTSGTFSIYAKSDGRDFVFLNVRSSGGASRAWFDLVNGTLGTVQAGNTGSILSVGNGWYRCSIYRATAIDEIEIGIADTDNSTTITDDDTIGLLLYGLQMEEGSPIATSYMPTTGSTFTRGKDEASMTNVSGLIGQKEGTLYVEVDWRLASGTFQTLLDVNDGTYDNRVFIFIVTGSQLRMYAYADGVFKTGQGESALGYSGIQKIAFAYKSGDFELYRNGSSVSSDVDPADSLAALGTLTNIDIGQVVGTLQQANMHIRAIQIIPRRLSDAQLIELTS